MFWLSYLFFVSLCSGLSWLVAARFARSPATTNESLRNVFAGLLPTLLIFVFLAVWEMIAKYQYVHGPTHEGFMGPMVGLIYGFPLFMGNFVANILTALWRGRSQ